MYNSQEKFFEKTQTFKITKKGLNLDQKFLPKIKMWNANGNLVKNLNCDQNSKFRSIIGITHKNRNFGRKSKL